MDKQRLSEWFLAQQCDDSRASAIVGDLYEEYGRSWLALRILVTALVMSRRVIAAIILTAVFLVSPGFWKWEGLAFPAIQALHLFGWDQDAHIWFPLLTLMSSSSWSLTLLCGLRYGWSELVTRVALVFSVLLSIDTLFVFKPQRRLAITCLIVTAVFILLTRRRTRRATLGLVAIGGAEYGILRVSNWAIQPLINGWAMHHHFLPAPLYNRGFENLWLSIELIKWILCAAVAMWMLKAVRHWTALAVEGS